MSYSVCGGGAGRIDLWRDEIQKLNESVYIERSCMVCTCEGSKKKRKIVCENSYLCVKSVAGKGVNPSNQIFFLL